MLSGAALTAWPDSAPSTAAATLPARQVEALNRGIVAMRTSGNSTGNIYVGWRLLGTDPASIAFNLYCSTNGGAAVKLNGSTPITATTNYVHSAQNYSQSHTYFVRPVINSVEQAASESYTLAANAPANQYRSIQLHTPPGGTTPDGLAYTYNANDASVGDVDGDGQYEIILKWDTSLSKDSSQDGFTGNTLFDCYKLDGTLLWRIDLGQNIRAGAHYTQFIVYDLDGDGRAEVAMKTAPGTIDGRGNPVLVGTDKVTDDYRSATTGRINSGPEYLTIFNGLTGAAMTTVPYKPDRVATTSWGDDYGNRQDRILMAVAYLDGTRPSLVLGRGIFPGQTSTHAVRNEITAWDYRNGALTMKWWFRASKGNSTRGIPDQNTAYIGQGNYEMQPTDVDGDGRDEIVYGSMTVDDNGQPLYSTGLGHGDALAVGDLDPDHVGREVYMPMESPGSNGHITANVHDGASGSILFDTFTRAGDADPDVGRGNAFDIDPRYSGAETWDSYNTGVYNVHSGVEIQPKPSNMFINFGIWWDADPMRELLDGTTISDYRIDPTTGTGGRSNYVFAPSGLASNNGTKSTPCLVADLYGDWREEVVWRTADNTALQIWSTTIAATTRIATLMHDVQYRESVAWQNVGYNQPTSTSFYLGSASDGGGGFAPIPAPNVYDATPTGSIAGRVFNDVDADGIFDTATESAVAGVTVFLDADNDGALDNGEPTTTTDSSGNYAFGGLANGSYTVRAVAPSGYAAAASGTANIPGGGAVTGVDLPLARTTYTGTASADAYTLRKNAAGQYEILVNNTLAYTVFAGAPSLSFNLLGGDDSLTIDTMHGEPAPAGGVTFDGGANADALNIIATPAADTATFASGSATVNGATFAQTSVESATFAGQGGWDAVTATGGAPLTLRPAQQLQSLAVAAGATVVVQGTLAAGTISATRSLAVDPAGKLDMLTGGLAVNYSPGAASPLGSWSGSAYTGIAGFIAAGAIRSSSASAGYTQVAAADAADVLELSPAQTATWGGQTADATTVLVRYTYTGDANLDGKVDIDDYTRIDSSISAGGALRNWSNGDFNFDGAVDIDDYTIIDSILGVQGPPLG